MTSPFDDIRALLKSMPSADGAARDAARAREADLTKPAGALGRLEEIAEFLAAWQGGAPHVDNPLVAVFAANHGVVAQGVSAFPASVTEAMVANFQAGGAAINQICKTFDLSLKVYELALSQPTGDITLGPAMDERACAATMAFGMEALAGGPDLLVLGEMGIGNTTVAAAVYAALFGGEPEDWVGRGAGVDDAGLARKADAVRRALARHADALGDPLEILRRLGGREIAAIAGAILGARHQRVPVLLDGFVVCAAAAALHALDPAALDHCLAAHVSAEQGHARALRELNKAPLLSLGMRLGEGTGGALAVGLARAAVACHNGMATFAEAGVAGKEGVMRVLTALAALVAALGAARADTIIDDWAAVKPPPAPTLQPVTVDPHSDALLLLDIDGHDAAGSGPCNRATKPRCLAMLPRVRGALDAARAHGVYVVYSLAGAATPADIWPEVSPREGEPVVTSGPDKFLGTNLRELLEAKGIKRVIVTGTASEGAVLATASDAAFHGMSVVIPVDGMASTELYAEQYVAWHMTHAPGVAQKTVLTTLDRLKY